MSDPKTSMLSEHANGEVDLNEVDPPATYIANVTTTEPARISPGREIKQAINTESAGTCHRTHPGEHSSQPKFLNSQSEWNPTGVLELDAQIQYQTNIVLLTPDWDPKKPGLICDLAMLYSHRFNSRGNLVDLSMWVEWQAKAYLLTPEHHPTKATLLSLLISSLCSRLARLGHPADLNLAIWYINQSMILTPNKRSQCEQGLLSQLGSLYFQRFMRLGNFNDLENAIVYQTEETLLIPDEHPSKTVSLENLGHMYYTRFNRLRTIMDLDKAIEHYIQALSLLTQKDNRNKALSLGKAKDTR
ncbi:hypothetical protein FRC12_014315 [Ceratobasidium sp. 428]|nr:hypothetical protein FRC12_014315 [Ceratobasidium sp. 428]